MSSTGFKRKRQEFSLAATPPVTSTTLLKTTNTRYLCISFENFFFISLLEPLHVVAESRGLPS